MNAQDYISGTGEMQIHDACEAGVNYEDLAKVKLSWFKQHHEADIHGSHRMLTRFLEYNKRADDAELEHRAAEAGSERAKHYHYRWSYYVVLVQHIQDLLAGLITGGRLVCLETVKENQNKTQ